MYPQVRVRKSEDQVSEQVAAAYLLKFIESLSLKGRESTLIPHADQERKVDPKSSGVITSPTSEGRPKPTTALEGKNTNGSDEDKRSNIRASSVPPPRAVLSSPDNDGIVGHQNKRIQGRRIPVNGQEPDNRHGPLSQCSRTCSKVDVSNARAKRASFNSNVIEGKAKRLPFSLNMQTQSRTHICDVKTAKRSSGESSSDSSAAGDARGHNAYPKIKCSQTVKLNSKTKKI